MCAIYRIILNNCSEYFDFIHTYLPEKTGYLEWVRVAKPNPTTYPNCRFSGSENCLKKFILIPLIISQILGLFRYVLSVFRQFSRGSLCLVLFHYFK